MAKFPEPPPPEELPQPKRSEILTLSPGTSLWRVYFRAGPRPAAWNAFRHFGPTQARFDPHTEPPRIQERGIMYVAAKGPTCLAEVFQQTRTIDRVRNAPWLVELTLEQEIRVLDLRSRWITRAGASSAIDSGPRPRARRWSQAIYAALPELSGLVYRSSMDPPGAALALWERATGALPQHPRTHRALSDPTLLRTLHLAARDLGYVVV